MKISKISWILWYFKFKCLDWSTTHHVYIKNKKKSLRLEHFYDWYEAKKKNISKQTCWIDCWIKHTETARKKIRNKEEKTGKFNKLFILNDFLRLKMFWTSFECRRAFDIVYRSNELLQTLENVHKNKGMERTGKSEWEQEYERRRIMKR